MGESNISTFLLNDYNHTLINQKIAQKAGWLLKNVVMNVFIYTYWILSTKSIRRVRIVHV